MIAKNKDWMKKRWEEKNINWKKEKLEKYRTKRWTEEGEEERKVEEN